MSRIGNEVANTPGPVYQWQAQLCPLLTAVGLLGEALKGPSHIVRPNGNPPPASEFHPTPCQGVHCSWFTKLADADNIERGDGACCFALAPVLQMQHLRLLRPVPDDDAPAPAPTPATALDDKSVPPAPSTA